jgi:DnaJ-domain-containing protein 1
MDSLTQDKLRILVEIRHQNDEVTICFIFTDDNETIYDLMGNPHPFLCVELLDGEYIFIAKSDIRAFKICLNKKDSLYNIWSFDPYCVMQVEQNIDAAALQKQYIQLLKMTHPDVIDTQNLHPAFKILATDMTRRIMSAFEFIRSDISLAQYNEKKQG